nr:helix-turn-helix domain-containing protein [Thalassobacillus sp. C254]
MSYIQISAAKKLEVISFYESSGCTIKEVCAEYGISSVTFNKWRQLYRKHGFLGLQPQRAGRTILKSLDY